MEKVTEIYFSCRKRNVSYKTYCLKCAADAGADEKTLRVNINDNIKFYFGETFRDAYSRGVEHLSDYVGQTDDSHMMKLRLSSRFLSRRDKVWNVSDKAAS